MKQLIYTSCVLTALAAFSMPALANVTLIDQATVIAAGGFPYTISQTGSYRLIGNLLNDAADTPMIAIKAPNVTLDFDGFTISCPACKSVDTALVTSNTLGTVLRNGTIQAPVGSTATCVSLSGPNARVANMTINWCETGIQTASGGDSLKVSNGMFYGIGGACIDTPAAALLTVSDSTFDSCGKIGILAGGVALITGNTFFSGQNSYFAIGITAGNGTAVGATVTNNTISGGASGVSGLAGVGSNTFVGIPNHLEITAGATSMKNNVCSNGSGC